MREAKPPVQYVTPRYIEQNVRLCECVSQQRVPGIGAQTNYRTGVGRPMSPTGLRSLTGGLWQQALEAPGKEGFAYIRVLLDGLAPVYRGGPFRALGSRRNETEGRGEFDGLEPPPCAPLGIWWVGQVGGASGLISWRPSCSGIACVRLVPSGRPIRRNGHLCGDALRKIFYLCSTKYGTGFRLNRARFERQKARG